MRTEAEIKELKRQWEYDPCWDIEDTEGFEDHREELTRFHKETSAIWKLESEEREKAKAKAKAIEIGVTDNPVLLKAIVRMQNQIQTLMERLDKIEEG